MILNPVRGAKFRENMAWLYNSAPMLNVSEQDCLLEQKKKYEKKEEWHQRHNLTVLSQLPVARSGAVG